jgi:hypothetical protein
MGNEVVSVSYENLKQRSFCVVEDHSQRQPVAIANPADSMPHINLV